MTKRAHAQIQFGVVLLNGGKGIVDGCVTLDRIMQPTAQIIQQVSLARQSLEVS